jgi:xanthine dehydrogenase accessory factor
MGEVRKVRVTIAEAEGSVPRDCGTSMVVLEGRIEGTIGGGALEHQAMLHAMKLLAGATGEPWQRDVLRLPLGPALGQCCGGFVRLLFEVISGDEAGAGAGARLTARPLRSGVVPLAASGKDGMAGWPRTVAAAAVQMLAGGRPVAARLVKGRGGEPDWLIEQAAGPRPLLCLWGAGHVGRAIVRVAEGLPIGMLWIDTAPERFPASMPAEAERIVAPEPSAFVRSAPAGAYHLVMTYSHQLDQSVCAALLARGDFAFLGLIGSATKRARFHHRLREAGHSESVLARLVCPIGIGGITGKEPAAIAVAAVAQLLQEIGKASAAGHVREVA